MIEVLIVYYSLGGNTEVFANKIKEYLISQEQECDVLVLEKNSNYEHINIENYDLVFIGSPTYGRGSTPDIILDYLRYLLKLNDFTLPKFSVCGTGDTQWRQYARAVDEIAYHLSKKTEVVDNLKIEQRPTSVKQINKINNFVEKSLGRI